MDKNICPKCATENEKEYEYCKNCGTPIKEKPTKSAAPDFDATAPNNYSYSYTDGNFVMDRIGGIPSDEVAVFVNKNSTNIIAKFSKMELTNTKVSWCWPVAVLGFLFGPVGAAFWFFYRKMYKKAAIFTAIGIALNLFTALITASMPILDYEALMIQILNNDLSGVIQSIGTPTLILMLLSDVVTSVASILTCILCGMFALNAYKNHCVKAICDFKASVADQRYYRFGLSSLGGTSAGMVVLGILIYYISNFIISFALTIFSII